MLSRTAENLYWLARYVERAEYLARTIEATLRVTALPHTYIGQTNEWDSALLTAGVSATFYEAYEEANEQNVVEYLSFAPGNPSSIRNCIENAPRPAKNWRDSCASCRKPRCGSTARPTGPCCATTPTGSRGSGCIWSAPTTPRASSTSSITCCCPRKSMSAVPSIITSGPRSCVRCRR